MISLPESPVETRQSAASDNPLLKSEEWLRLAAKGSPMGLWYWNEETGRVFWDAKSCEIFDVGTEGEKTLDTFYSCLHPDDRERVREIWRYQLEHGLPFEMEYRVVGRDGSIRWIDALGSGYYDQQGKPLRMVGVHFDVSERKKAEQKHFDLSGRLINAQEKERSRLARELHDDFSQRLALLAIDLESVAEMILDSPAAASKRVHELWGEVSEIGADLHSLSHRLHSTTLESLGLVAGVDSYCKEIARKQGLQIDVVHEDMPKPIHPEISLCLFRIVQETLRNVSKHSRASRVEVRLKGSSEAIWLTLRDNGIGFDLSKNHTSGGIGIQSMNERARMIGGTFQVESAPMRGTQITVKVPLNSVRTRR